MRFLDAHTHVQFAAFKEDSKEVIDRALKEGVWLVNVGTQKDTSAKAIEIAAQYAEGVYATVGLHPIHTGKSYHDAKELGAEDAAKGFTSRGEEFDYAAYKELALHPKVVAVGECGLDYFRIEGDAEEAKRRQKLAFEQQIELAKAVGKPLMIHCREAFADLADILAHSVLPEPPGVVHFFTGSMDDAKAFLKLGFSFTFGGAITFPPKAGQPPADVYEVIQMLPMDRILSETDAPYVTPVPHRGKRNEPSYVIEVVKKLAELKGVPVEEMRDRIFGNARRVLRLP